MLTPMVNSAQYASERRNVLVRSVLPSWAGARISASISCGITARSVVADDVARAAHCVNEWLLETLVHRLPQPADVHVYQIGLRIELQVPHAFEEHRARDHLTGTPHEVLEQGELARREVQVLAGARRAAPEQVEL